MGAPHGPRAGQITVSRGRALAAVPALLRALRDCRTEPGATCLARDNKQYMKRRLQAINAIVDEAMAKIGDL